MTRFSAFISDIFGRTRLRDLPPRLALYAGLWWLLTGGGGDAWFWGGPAVAAAAVITPLPAHASWRISILGVTCFVPVFVGFSLRSATDIALRALHPQRPIQPALLDYPWRLPDNGSRVFLANLINLMPGTLCVRMTDKAMTVHTMGDSNRILASLERLETLSATLFKQPLNHGQ